MRGEGKRAMFKRLQRPEQVGSVLVLHAAVPGSVPRTPYGYLNPPGGFLTAEPEVTLNIAGLAPKQTKEGEKKQVYFLVQQYKESWWQSDRTAGRALVAPHMVP